MTTTIAPVQKSIPISDSKTIPPAAIVTEIFAGILIALASGFYPVLAGEAPFTHDPAPGERPIRIGRLELMTAVLFDVGVFLLVTGALVALIHLLAQPPEESEVEEAGR